MAGNIDHQGILAPQAVPGPQMPYGELLAEYPELADDIMALTAWRDGPYDQKGRDFNRMYPSLEPYPYVG